MNALTDLHGMVVHFPIALLFVSVGLQAAALLPKLRSQLDTAALITLIVGTLGAAVSVMTGPEGNARGVSDLIEAHQRYAQITLILFAVLSVWRLFLLWTRKQLAGAIAVAFVLVGCLGLGSLGYTGYLGGRMVYTQAVGVQRNGVPVAPPVRGHRGQGGPATAPAQ